MLPGADGFTIVRALREAQRYTPVLMLTARSRPEDVLEGLEARAPTTISPKPFDLSILLARIKSLLRRTAWQRERTQETPATEPNQAQNTTSTIEPFASITLELVAPNRTTHLTIMEADLLRYLTEHEGQIVSRKDILEQVWRVHEDTDTRAIDNFIVRLRRYIEDDPANPQHLITVRGDRLPLPRQSLTHR